MIEQVGWIVMVLLVFALVWLGVRVVVGLRMALRGDHEVCLDPGPVNDRPRPQDAVVDRPQDAPYGPQDAAHGPQDAMTADVDQVAQSRPAVPAPSGDLTLAIAAGLCWSVARAVGELVTHQGTSFTGTVPGSGSPLEGEPTREWVAAQREIIMATAPRPDIGPACFGGRDDATYLRGWDDAVDWISQGRDAKGPSWGDIAYMTGWSDAVRAIGVARRDACTALAA